MTRTIARGIALAIALVALSGCDGTSPAPPSPPAASPTDPAASPPEGAAAEGSHCSNAQRVAEDGAVLGGRSRGDIDGDGSPDDVAYLVLDDDAPGDCRVFLVAETEDGRFVTPTTEEGVAYALPEPRIHSIVQIDGSGGEEILVDLEQGATTRFIGMFTIVKNALRRVVVAEGTNFGNLLPYGGSVGHSEGSNCSDGPGDVVVTVATANATDYTIRVRYYELDGAVLRPLPRSEQPPTATGEDIDQWVGLRGSPFGDCPQARGGVQ